MLKLIRSASRCFKTFVPWNYGTHFQTCLLACKLQVLASHVLSNFHLVVKLYTFKSTCFSILLTQITIMCSPTELPVFCQRACLLFKLDATDYCSWILIIVLYVLGFLSNQRCGKSETYVRFCDFPMEGDIRGFMRLKGTETSESTEPEFCFSRCLLFQPFIIHDTMISIYLYTHTHLEKFFPIWIFMKKLL